MAVDYISAFPAPLWPTPAEELTVITRPFTVLAEACKLPAATVPRVYSFLNCLNTAHQRRRAPRAAFRPAEPPLTTRNPGPTSSGDLARQVSEAQRDGWFNSRHVCLLWLGTGESKYCLSFSLSALHSWKFEISSTSRQLIGLVRSVPRSSKLGANSLELGKNMPYFQGRWKQAGKKKKKGNFPGPGKLPQQVANYISQR